MTRHQRIKSSIWSTLQSAVRRNDYKNVSSKLNIVTNDARKETTDLNDTDREVIEGILSDIAELLEY